MDESRSSRRLIIISGMSGAGKSLALKTLEDQDFFCIDNLPISLFKQLTVLLIDTNNSFPSTVAISIDARNSEGELLTLPESIATLKKRGLSTEVVFMEASKNILTARFSETRRKHPLSTVDISLTDAIDRERQVLDFLSAIADIHIDTCHTDIHELRDMVRDQLAHRPSGSLSIQFVSFGYKNGIPRDADFVFDVRCLPNPHWQKRLRDLSGKDQAVIEFLSQQQSVNKMNEQLSSFLTAWIPSFVAENRSYLCVAIGCTGGHHRSVYLVEKLSKYFQERGEYVIARHRDLLI